MKYTSFSQLCFALHVDFYYKVSPIVDARRRNGNSHHQASRYILDHSCSDQPNASSSTRVPRFVRRRSLTYPLDQQSPYGSITRILSCKRSGVQVSPPGAIAFRSGLSDFPLCGPYTVHLWRDGDTWCGTCWRGNRRSLRRSIGTEWLHGSKFGCSSRTPHNVVICSLSLTCACA